MTERYINFWWPILLRLQRRRFNRWHDKMMRALGEVVRGEEGHE